MKEKICVVVIMLAMAVLAAVSGAFTEGTIECGEYIAIAAVCLVALSISAIITNQRTGTLGRNYKDKR